MFNKEEWIRKYREQDSRLQTTRIETELIANNNGWNYERIISAGRGVWEIHQIPVLGLNVPFRVISMEEETQCVHAALCEMKNNYKEFVSGTELYHFHLQRLKFIKFISLATTASPVATSEQDRFLTETDLKALPAFAFAEFVRVYQKHEEEFNPYLNDVSEETIATLIQELQDPEKKYQLLAGMTTSQLRASLCMLLEIGIEHADNLQLSKLLSESEKDTIDKFQTISKSTI